MIITFFAVSVVVLEVHLHRTQLKNLLSWVLDALWWWSAELLGQIRDLFYSSYFCEQWKSYEKQPFAILNSVLSWEVQSVRLALSPNAQSLPNHQACFALIALNPGHTYNHNWLPLRNNAIHVYLWRIRKQGDMAAAVNGSSLTEFHLICCSAPSRMTR